MNEKDIEHFYPTNQQEWRDWLEKNHETKDAVWLIQYKKNSGMSSINWSDAVDEALCFGWIDSKAVSIDETSFKHYYCKRKPTSTWSKINKEKVKRLIANNLMAEAGLACIEVAKQNGTWTILDDVEELIIPKDLEAAFRKQKGSKKYFRTLSPSRQKFFLQWIVLAKQPTTRQKRIYDVACLLLHQENKKE